MPVPGRAMPDYGSMSLVEFIDRFALYMTRHSGFARFGDGQSVHAYALIIANTYWDDLDQRAHGPEACARVDMERWGER